MKLTNNKWVINVTIEIKHIYVHIVILQDHNICRIDIFVELFKITFWYKIINNF